uniref:Uncharacterized protein n=1 Tax=Arundo donax TaxID=35708 RepID=A0A0A9AV95_ARUDO
MFSYTISVSKYLTLLTFGYDIRSFVLFKKFCANMKKNISHALNYL